MYDVPVFHFQESLQELSHDLFLEFYWDRLTYEVFEGNREVLQFQVGAFLGLEYSLDCCDVLAL